jgi:ADP-heptose:LPS heptosyltransferase
MSLVAFHANGIGDDIINRHALASIAGLSGGKATLITSHRPRGHFLLDDLPFDEIIRIPVEKGHFDLRKLLPQLPKTIDTFVSLAPYFSDDLSQLRAACNAKATIGFGDEYDHRVDMLAKKNAVELAFDVAAAVPGVRALDSRPPFIYDTEIMDKVRVFVRNIRQSRTPSMLCVHSETFHTKRISHITVQDVVCRFLAAHDDFVAIFLDVARFDHVCPCHAHRIITVDDMALQFAIALLQHADVFFGVDSCMLHAADYLGIPGVVAFREATSPGKFGYFWSPVRHLTLSSPSDRNVVEQATRGLAKLVEQARGYESFQRGRA